MENLRQYKLIHGECIEEIKNNRRFIGIEVNKNYFDIAKDRIERAYMEE